MNSLTQRDDTSRSPLISAADLAAHAGDLPVPQPHTEAELAAVVGLSTGPRSLIETVAIGHGRAACRNAALAIAAAWAARGSRVLTVVDWPETAASWLRPATRLTAETPDWVIAGPDTLHGLRGASTDGGTSSSTKASAAARFREQLA
ncbi:hypothetical protein [Streptomyces sp. NPDC059224]|uniref:hypothetical protein n=1 Tax=Streptomyces sp. NPDC059224 TaxID=3346775 RepID=UPI0036A17E68